MTDASVRVRALVRGRVQGVGYRAFVVDRGGRLGLRGTVANRPDGSVECVVEGSRRDVDSLVADLRRGPWLARVEAVDVHEEPAAGQLPDIRMHA